jgi:uncharacterized membrane protein YecN with MAPEG domain
MANPLSLLHAVPITALYAALNVLLTVALSMNVSRLRGKVGVIVGDGGSTALTGAIRAHGNNVENVPLALMMLLIAELCGGNSTFLHILGGTLLVARVLHAHGMTQTDGRKPLPTHFLGSVLTLLFHVVLAGYVLWLRPWGS